MWQGRGRSSFYVNEDAMKNITATSVVALLLAFTLNVADAPFATRSAMAAPQVSQAVGKPLKEAQTLLGSKNFKGALDKIQEAEGQSGKSAYESFLITSLKGQAYAGLKDFNNAAKAMEAALATGQAQGAQSTQILRQIMGFYSQANNTGKTLEMGQRYLKEVGPDADIQMALASSYLQQKNYKAAEDMVRSAIKTVESKGGVAKKEQLASLRFIAHEQGNAAAEQQALEMLLQRYPSPEYWDAMLVSAARTIKGPNANVDIARLKYLTGGMKTADDYMNLAQEALVQKLPAEAQKVIDAGLQKKLLGQGAQKDRHMRLVELTKQKVAEDKASLAQREADAAASPAGDLSLELGESYWSYGQNDKAVTAIQNGIKKGVKDKDDAQLRLGIVHITAGKRDLAAHAFKAIKPGTAAAQTARLWTLYAATK